jgi:hypothetical protein
MVVCRGEYSRGIKDFHLVFSFVRWWVGVKKLGAAAELTHLALETFENTGVWYATYGTGHGRLFAIWTRMSLFRRECCAAGGRFRSYLLPLDELAFRWLGPTDFLKI